MPDAPAFDFYPERFWTAVEGWSDRDIVKYLRLLSQSWLRDGLRPDELQRLARGKVPPLLCEKFPLAADGRHRNPMQENLRAEQRQRILKRRVGAALTNLHRYGQAKLSPDDLALVQQHAPDKLLAQRTPSDSLSDTPSDRSATPQRHASDSPPPTTHHSPHDNNSQPFTLEPDPAPVNTALKTPDRRQLPTLEQARDHGPAIGVTPDEAEKWWHAREASNWTRSSNGVAIPIGVWTSDLKTFVNHLRNREAEQAARTRPPQRARHTPFTTANALTATNATDFG